MPGTKCLPPKACGLPLGMFDFYCSLVHFMIRVKSPSPVNTGFCQQNWVPSRNTILCTPPVKKPCNAYLTQIMKWQKMSQFLFWYMQTFKQETDVVSLIQLLAATFLKTSKQTGLYRSTNKFQFFGLQRNSQFSHLKCQ